MIISAKEMDACLSGEIGDPHSMLGLNLLGSGQGLVVRCLSPSAERVELIDLRTHDAHPMKRLTVNGFFELHMPLETKAFPYRFLSLSDSNQWEWEDPYRFSPSVENDELEEFREGMDRRPFMKLGSHPRTLEGVDHLLWAFTWSVISIHGIQSLFRCVLWVLPDAVKFLFHTPGSVRSTSTGFWAPTAC